MKFRTSFVTNSSSSSFVCEICGRTESGFDMGISDCEMAMCENGHTFCQSEMLELPPKEEMIKTILENAYNKDRYDYKTGNYKTISAEELKTMDEDELFEISCGEDRYYNVPECVCPICQFIEYSESDLSAYLLKQYGIPREEIFAEIKRLNKRRRKLYDSEYITYICKQFDLDPAKIVAGWKEKFNSYNDFSKWLYSKD
jgi:hypothetical protein